MTRDWLVALRAEPGLWLWRKAEGLFAKLWFSLQGVMQRQHKDLAGGFLTLVTLLGSLLHRRELYLIGVYRPPGCRLQ